VPKASRKPETKAAVARRLEQAAFFRGLGDAALLAIARDAYVKSLKAGQLLWKPI